MTLRVLTISKPYVSASNRKKLTLLAQDPDLEIGLICPEAWTHIQYESGQEDYWIKQLPIQLNGQNHLHFYLGLEAAIREFQPHVLNIEEEHYSFVTYQAMRIARKLGIPALFYSWQNIHKRYPLPFRLIERYNFTHAALAMVGNDAAAQSIMQKGYTGRIHKSPQIGVDIDMYQQRSGPETTAKLREELGLPIHDFIALGAGRIVAEKGFQTLLKAATDCRQRFPDLPLTVVIVGTGNYLKDLQNQYAEQDLAGCVRFTGAVPSTIMPKYFGASDVMCLPSLTLPNWKEQGPTRVISEAFATGTNVITSDSGELPEVVGDAGLVFPEGNAGELATCLHRCWATPTLRQECQDRGRQRVMDKFSAQAIADNFKTAFFAAADNASH